MKKSILVNIIKESINQLISTKKVDTAIIFFLPTSTRPINYPPLPSRFHNWKFWHVGIIYKNTVYECFNNSRCSITEFKNKSKELTDMKAVFVRSKINLTKLKTELESGTSCSEYVARVAGVSNNSGPVKQYSPDELYKQLQ